MRTPIACLIVLTATIGCPPSAFAERTGSTHAEPAPERRWDWGMLTRGGLRLSTDETRFTAHMAGRLTPRIFEIGDPTSTRSHQLRPTLQFGVEMESDGLINDFQPHAAIALLYRTHAPSGRVDAVSDLPLTITIEPGLRLRDLSPDITVSVMTEDWGGVYAQVGYDRVRGIPTLGLGIEGGTWPTGAALMVIFAAAIVHGLGNADMPDDTSWCISRCYDHQTSDP